MISGFELNNSPNLFFLYFPFVSFFLPVFRLQSSFPPDDPDDIDDKDEIDHHDHNDRNSKTPNTTASIHPTSKGINFKIKAQKLIQLMVYG